MVAVTKSAMKQAVKSSACVKKVMIFFPTTRGVQVHVIDTLLAHDCLASCLYCVCVKNETRNQGQSKDKLLPF